MYDPAIGRWHCADPAAELAHNWTPYRYGFNNPILFNDAFGLWEQTANGWTTDNADDIARFMSMIEIEEAKYGDASMAQVDKFISEEFNGSGGKLSDGSVLLSDVTATKDKSGNWNVSDYGMYKMSSEVRNYGSYAQNHNNFVSPFSFYSYKYYRERSWHGNGGSSPLVSIASFGLGLASDKMLNKYSWFSLKTMKTYNTSFNGNGYTGGKLKHAGKWSKRLGRTGKLVGIYGFYTTVTEYSNDHKLTEFGLGYIGGTDLLGTFGNLYMGAFGVGTSLGKWVVESDTYFNAVHKDRKAW